VAIRSVGEAIRSDSAGDGTRLMFVACRLPRLAPD
jgi:hypothetical protein